MQPSHILALASGIVDRLPVVTTLGDVGPELGGFAWTRVETSARSSGRVPLREA